MLKVTAREKFCLAREKATAKTTREEEKFQWHNRENGLGVKQYI
jgi:hypothetical protein